MTMWLLDHNLPKQIFTFLKSQSIDCHTTQYMGWAKLANGDLVSTANKNGFTCILTKDIDFAKAAAKALVQFPEMAVVVITLKQERGAIYANSFAQKWTMNPITPIKGKLTNWPERH